MSGYVTILDSLRFLTQKQCGTKSETLSSRQDLPPHKTPMTYGQVIVGRSRIEGSAIKLRRVLDLKNLQIKI